MVAFMKLQKIGGSVVNIHEQVSKNIDIAAIVYIEGEESSFWCGSSKQVYESIIAVMEALAEKSGMKLETVLTETISHITKVSAKGIEQDDRDSKEKEG